MHDLQKRVDQVTAFVLVPVIILMAFPLMTATHDVLRELALGFSGGDYETIIQFVVTVAVLGLFIGFTWFLYWWVSRGGPGVIR